MHKTDSKIIYRCRSLRKQGFTLGEIVKLVHLPKTTIYGHTSNVVFSYGGIKRLENIRKIIQQQNTKFINEFNIKFRKGKCIPGRIVLKPKNWSNELICLVAHFMFDGEIQSHSCIYSNRNKALVERVKNQMKIIFNLMPYELFNKETGVHRISYHYVELANYMRDKAQKLKKYIRKVSLPEKKIFLRAFFDDEGCAYKNKNKKQVRGYQHNLEILKLVQKLLKDFNIESKIDEKYNEIVISREENLIKFRDEINFSKGVYINPERKNSIWKKKSEKREILNKIINSYKK